MSSRDKVRQRLALAAALVMLLVSNTAARAHEAEPPRAAASPADAPFLGVIGAAPDFSLRDTDGRSVELSDDHGHVVLIAFVYTSCTSACPLLSQKMSSLQRELLAQNYDGQRVRFYSITVDPQRDSPDELARYARPFVRDAAAWRFLYESPERLRPVLAAYDEWTRPLADGELDHPARLYLIDAQGRIREIYSLAFFDEHQAFRDIEALLEEG